MERVVGRLGGEDLTRWRMCSAKLEAVGMRAEAYSATEIERAIYRQYRVLGELSVQHNLPAGVEIDPATGICISTDEGEA